MDDPQEIINQTNPEPCTVGGVIYNHGHQVPRDDPCEFCLCLDGELFCWWQDCPPTGPCRTSRSISSCANSSSSSSSSSNGDAATSVPQSAGTSALETEAAVTDGNTGTTPTSTTLTPTTTITTSTATTTPSTSTVATTCYVMGTEYKVGEVLPRDTGTCLECICDSEARVTCSPKDCTSPRDPANSLDMFDVDTF